MVCENCNKNPCQCVDRIRRSIKKMGWKIDLENDFEKLKSRVTKLEKILESLNEAVKAPKKKPVKKRKPKDLKIIAEA